MVALLVCAGGCGASGGTSPATTGPAPSVQATASAGGPVTVSPLAPGQPAGAAAPPAGLPLPSAAGTCRVRGSGLYVLPDPSCTPGATYPAVTQGDIDQTICRSGWTATVRPPVSYTEPLKYQQMTAYGETGSARYFEEDHLVPLELGGSPSSPRNLWPEPGASPNPKDSVENAANRAVCDGRMTLAAAQRAIAVDWITLGDQLGVPQPQTPGAQIPAPQGSGPGSGSPASAGGAATCSASASYSSSYGDWDVYVRSNQPGQAVTVTTAGGTTASYRTDSSGYADVYLHAPESASGQRVTVTVGGATCATNL